ncbi:MAG: calcium-binding protein [Candidatus Nanopelagicales bacterium]
MSSPLRFARAPKSSTSRLRVGAVAVALSMFASLAPALAGTPGNDAITGTPRAQTHKGGAGNDTINAKSGNDRVSGGGGKDTLNGGKGHDTINAGPGSDTLRGSTGSDVLVGGSGADTLSGGPGSDVLVGGPGPDTITCGPGADTVAAGPNDELGAGCQGPNDNDLSAQEYSVSFTSGMPMRLQWNANSGYCGETSFVTAMMTLGQYASQWTVRALANPSVPQTNPNSQLLPSWPSNSGPPTGQSWQNAADAMSLDVDGFNTYDQLTDNNGVAATEDFLAWVKTEAVAGNKVIIGVFNNIPVIYDGTASAPFANSPDDPKWGQYTYDHVVPVMGIGSDNPFENDGSETYYANDTITIGDNALWTPFQDSSPSPNPAYDPTNWGAGNSANNPQYSGLFTFENSFMMGDRGWANTFPTACAACANDAACNSACAPYVYSLYNNTSWAEHPGDYPGQAGNYGVSIQGVLGADETVPVALEVEVSDNDLNNEGPNPGTGDDSTWNGPQSSSNPPSPVDMNLNATVDSLQPGTSYNVYLYTAALGSFPTVPTGDFNQQASQAQELWTLTWDESANSWDIASTTAASAGWQGTCSSGSCSLNVTETNIPGQGNTDVTSANSYAFRAVAN